VKVYAVSSGEYSYYTIEAVFTTKELAEAHCAVHGGSRAYGEAFVEEFPLFDRLPERVTWYGRSVRLNEQDDDAHTPDAFERIEWEYDVDEPLSRRPRLDITYTAPWRDSQGLPQPGYYNLYARGLALGPVNQAIDDQIAQWKAQRYRLNNAELRA
jgi:hypothetical protein